MQYLENEIAGMTPESEPKRFTFSKVFEFRGTEFPPGDYVLRLVNRDDEIMPKLDRVR